MKTFLIYTLATITGLIVTSAFCWIVWVVFPTNIRVPILMLGFGWFGVQYLKSLVNP